MMDFLTAIGLMLVLEGSLYALMPDQMKKTMIEAIKLPAATLRMIGLTVAVFGFIIIAVLRGY